MPAAVFGGFPFQAILPLSLSVPPPSIGPLPLPNFLRLANFLRRPKYKTSRPSLLLPFYFTSLFFFHVVLPSFRPFAILPLAFPPYHLFSLLTLSFTHTPYPSAARISSLAIIGNVRHLLSIPYSVCFGLTVKISGIFE